MARLHLFKKLKERLVARLEKWIAILQEKAIELNFELLEAKGFIVLKDIQLKKEIPSTFVSYFLIGPHSLICMDVRNWKGKLEGNPSSTTWKKINENGSEKTKPNPILKNQNNIIILQQMLGKDYPVSNIVFFPYAKIGSIQSDNVATLDTLQDKVDALDSFNPPLSEEEMSKIAHRFAKKAKKNDVDEQIEVIKSIKKKKKSPTEKKIIVIGDDPFLHERDAFKELVEKFGFSEKQFVLLNDYDKIRMKGGKLVQSTKGRKDKYAGVIFGSVPHSSSNMPLGKFSSEDLGEDYPPIIHCTLTQQNGKLRLTKSSFAKALLKLQNKERVLLEIE